MSLDDTLGGFVLDTSALAALGSGENIYATTWADRAAVRGIVLLVPAAALSEAWQQIRRHDPLSPESWSTAVTSPQMWPPRRWRPAPGSGTGQCWRPRQLACKSSTRN